MYTITFKFTDEIDILYNDIKFFETTVEQRRMKILAMPEKLDSEKEAKQIAWANFLDEVVKINERKFIKIENTDNVYHIINFVEEIIEILKMNCFDYTKNTNDKLTTHTFKINDVNAPFLKFITINKIYPHFLSLITSFRLSKDVDDIIEFKNLDEIKEL